MPGRRLVGPVGAIAVTYGPGLAGSLLVGVNFAKALAWVHDLPLVGVNHLEGHVYARGCVDAGEAEREEPVFPLVALVVSGGHTFLVEMRDHLTYRLLGTTVDDAAGEAFDKVGRLLGLGYPGGPAIGRAAEAATAPRPCLPPGLAAATRTTSASRASRPRPDGSSTEARADAGLAETPEEPLPDAVVAELAWGFQDSVVDVLTTKTIRAARAVGARSIVLGGGVAANSALRARLAGEAEALGVPLIVPRRPVHRQRRDDRRRRRAPVRRRRSRRARPGRPAVAAAARRWRPRRPVRERPVGRRRRRTRPSVRATLRDAGLRARHAPVAELPRRHRRARGDPGRGRTRARPAGPRDRPGPRPADRRPPRRGRRGHGRRARSRPGRLPARPVRRTAIEAGPLCGSSRATRSTRTWSGWSSRPYDVVANLPYHITSPILHALLGRAATTGTARADGPARGRRADRGAAREDELPVRLRAVPRPGPDRLPRPGRRPSSPSPPSSRRSSWSSRTTPTTGSTPRPRTSSGASSRPRSASGAR